MYKKMFSRRSLFRSAAIIAGGVPLAAHAAKSKKPEKMPAQVGDVLAFPSWENAGRLVKASELSSGEKPLTVYPHDLTLGITRERFRLNQILLLKLETSDIDEATAEISNGGLLAYSGVCTHTACAVSEWDDDKMHFICPCHSSEFDPKRQARVVNGPASRSLPSLSIEIRDDLIVISGGFSAKVGAKKKTGFS
ncbi:MAG: QcrA and Rieske domain-containing protein [Gammaproteobacteria bacterium]